MMELFVTAAAFAVIIASIAFYRGGLMRVPALPRGTIGTWKEPMAIGFAGLTFLVLQLYMFPGQLLFWGMILGIAGYVASHQLPASWGMIRKLPLIVGVAMVIWGGSQGGLGKWVSRTWTISVEKCLGDQTCPQLVITKQEGPLRLRPSSSGQIVAPANDYVWMDIPERVCFDWWVVQNPTGAPAAYIETLYEDRETKKVTSVPPRSASGQGWTSIIDRPVRIEYEMSARPAKGCSKFK